MKNSNKRLVSNGVGTVKEKIENFHMHTTS